MNILSSVQTDHIHDHLSAQLSLSSEDKKVRVMAATVQLVAENGIHATPMTQVSKLAHVSAGAIYHYFDSKETIIRETYLFLKQAHIDTMVQCDDSDAEYRERFLNFWQVLFQCFLAQGHFSFIEQCALSPIIDADTAQKVAEIKQPIADFFVQGITDKHIVDMPHYLLFYLIFSSIASAVKIQLSEHFPALTETEILQAALYCWNGLKTD